MKLHNDKQAFMDTILSVSRELNIAPTLIEKDYYVTLLLKELNSKISGLLFKGGTSLAKCYKIIDRFSEDLDLTLDNEHFSQSKKRNANKTVIEVCDDLGLRIDNREFLEKHSHGNYNVYNIEYPILFPSNDVKPFLKVEMVFIQKAYPDEVQTADSYIGSWLMNNGNSDAVEKLGLLPFQVRVQTLERTLVDKVFAICDYYLRNETNRNSRHIYDISKLLTKVKLRDVSLKMLIASVREDRKPNKTCVSAQDGVNVTEVLQKIIESEFFKKDYIDSTEKLLIKPVKYDEAIKGLDEIIKLRLFDFNDEEIFQLPSVLEAKKRVEEYAIKMQDRGFETIVGMKAMELYQKAKQEYKKHENSLFERLYNGENVFGKEEKSERKLMEYLAVYSQGDKESLLRVFKSSGQYNENKPAEYYEKLAEESLTKVARISQKPQNNPCETEHRLRKDDGNSK